jgi:hypothetical protein
VLHPDAAGSLEIEAKGSENTGAIWRDGNGGADFIGEVGTFKKLETIELWRIAKYERCVLELCAQPSVEQLLLRGRLFPLLR